MISLAARPARATPLLAVPQNLTAAPPGARRLIWTPEWDDLPTAVAAVDREGCFIGRSRGFAERVPKARSGGLAAPVLEDAFPHWTSAFERARAGEHVREEMASLADDGTTQWTRWELQPWGESPARAEAIWVVRHCITEERKAKAELLAACDAFEQMNAQLEAAIARANSLATEAALADQAKSAFLAMMSHEIRTPLTGVIGMAHILERTTLTEEQREYLRTIRVSGDALLAVLNDTLDYSKIEAGHLELDDAEFALATCIDEALDPLAGRAFAKGLELVAVVHDDVPLRVRGDFVRVRQILLNLVGNAVKFTEHGEIVVEVQRVPAANETSTCVLQFAVRDTGVGIQKERQDRLFQPFSQLERSTARTHGGTGLGLAISKRLAELMGGRMWVQSEAGCGATFFFTVAIRPVASVSRVLPESLRGRRMLLVEDNATTQRILRHAAETCGMQVEVVETITGARHKLQAPESYDLLVVDEGLPDGTGQQLLERLPTAHRPRCVVGYSVRSGRAFEGTDVLLHKPLKPEELLRACEQGLESAVANRVATLAEPAAAESGLPSTHAPLRILVAEDNAVNQRVVLLMLAQLGHFAQAVNNGADAVEALRREAYDVVLLDVHMPVLDGLAAARAIRTTLDIVGSPRIIALTAAATKRDRDEALAAGMHDFVTKPIRFEALQEALAHAVAAAR